MMSKAFIVFFAFILRVEGRQTQAGKRVDATIVGDGFVRDSAANRVLTRILLPFYSEAIHIPYR